MVERAKIYRKEQDRAIPIATAVFYIREGSWRLATKAECDVFEIQNKLADNRGEITVSIDIPHPEFGENGDFYALLYPLGWRGYVWGGGEVDTAEYV